MWMKASLSMALALVCLSATGAWAQGSAKLPNVVYWAAGDVGAYMYTVPAIVSEKIAPVLGVKIRLIPGNDVERVNMMRLGRAHLGALSADVYWGSMGLASYSTFALGPQPLRLVWAGWASYAGSTGIATKASGIKTPYDLKGKRVAIVIGAAWSSEGAKGTLAFGNLTLNDVTVIEVSTTGAAGKALVEGKADFTMLGTNTPGVYEAESSSFGATILRYPHEDRDAWARYRKFMPYHVPGWSTVGATIKPGDRIPTPQYPYPLTAVLANQPDDFVYAVAKAFHTRMDDIAVAFPGNDAMKTERGIVPDATVMAPFHPGAVRFFKEIGVWKDAHEKANAKKLAHLDRVQKRWATFTEDAQDRMAKTKKKVDLAKEWREIVEKEVGLVAE
ncbi:MAG: TAXI family TRAP transporter solute-binding subunit [Candidatus Rokubacteria bacterium]|nr:TAXI family TRAP transporter solute-binding subunit [Candidatus Rokubacteria bacterium]